MVDALDSKSNESIFVWVRVPLSVPNRFMKKVIKPNVEDLNKRIDVYLSLETGLARSIIKKYIIEGRVSQNGNIINKPSCKISLHSIELIQPEVSNDLKPENRDIDIIYEDNDIAVINKEAGIVTHPGAGNRNGTLVNFLLFHFKNLSTYGKENRPGIVHRLDKYTSGLIVIAKNNKAHKSLYEQFKDRTIKKKYWALTDKKPDKSEYTIDNLISIHPKKREKMIISKIGKRAITHFKVAYTKKGVTILDVETTTGRTHQIRVHLSSIGFPILGDKLYGSKKKMNRFYLHCYSLEISHPLTKERLMFKSSLPTDFREVLGEEYE